MKNHLLSYGSSYDDFFSDCIHGTCTNINITKNACICEMGWRGESCNQCHPYCQCPNQNSNACIYPNECHCESDSVDPKGLCFHKELNKSKSITQLEIKTICGMNWAGTNDWLSFTFCHSHQCCSTGDLQLTNGREDTANKKPVNCTIPDDFGSNMIGACKFFDFGSKLMVTGIVRISKQFGNQFNEWRGEWIKVILDESIIECPIDGWIDGDSSHPTYQKFSCSYQSKY